MTEEKLIHILRSASGIEPSEETRHRLHRLILSTPQRPATFALATKAKLVEYMTLGFALGLASLLLVTFVSGPPLWQKFLPASNSSQALRAEVENIDFTIQLKEAKYYNESAQEVASLLGEIDHESPTSRDSGVDEMLEKIIF
ncbi:MAG: hypothetical protein AAB407_00960 [Patescibacteria group bacterium]